MSKDGRGEAREEHVGWKHDEHPKTSLDESINVGIMEIQIASGSARRLETPTNHHDEIRDDHVVSTHVVGLEVSKEDLMNIGERDEYKEMECRKHITEDMREERKSSVTEEATSRGEDIRVRNHDAIGREMEDHVVCLTKQDATLSGEEEQEDYPWFATRVICNWLIKTMEQNGSLYWNVDDYDGKESYVERKLRAPTEFSKDPETKPYQYRRLRQELIKLEDWQHKNGFMYPECEKLSAEEICEKLK